MVRAETIVKNGSKIIFMMRGGPVRVRRTRTSIQNSYGTELNLSKIHSTHWLKVCCSVDRVVQRQKKTRNI